MRIITEVSAWSDLHAFLTNAKRRKSNVKDSPSNTHGNAALNIEVLIVVNAQLLGGELLQSIRILRLGRPGVVLLQASSLHLGLELLSLRVNAG